MFKDKQYDIKGKLIEIESNDDYDKKIKQKEDDEMWLHHLKKEYKNKLKNKDGK
jgi:hypothetical protein